MIYFYGGSFDPVTNAHIDILKTIRKIMNKSDSLIIGVANNDEKNYKCSLTDRMNMVQKIVSEKIKNSYQIFSQNHRTYKFLTDYTKMQGITAKDIIICIGEDEWKSLLAGKWVNYDLILNQFKFLIVGREHTEIDVKNYSAKIVTIPNSQLISSSSVRDILSRNPDCHFDDVKNYIAHQTFRYIKDNELYWQNGPEYEKEEKKFLADYAIKKKQNGWGEPSVTTDVVAYNGDEILLIRRGNFPYKNYWCTVGGFFDLTDEDLNHTASREFMEETTLKYNPEDFHQIKTYSHQFDPRMRIIDTAFEVRISKKDMKNAIGSDDAVEARWFNVNDLPRLGFHHLKIIEDWKKKNDKEDYL